MTLPIDYATLREIWWALVGVLLIGFAVTDGFDLGVAALLPFVARTDGERRLTINTVGPTWEGNQVWFILGGGAIFAAWPFVYATSFSGFYLAMFLVLAALILRPVGFKYRSKRPSPAWRGFWDWALFVGGLVPALVFGVAMGNVLSGAPFRLDEDLRSHYAGTLLGLFTPFTLLCGLLSVAMLVLHGAAWLSVKAEPGPVRDRARMFGLAASLASIVLFCVGGLYIAYGPLGFRLTGLPDASGPSNPLHSTVLSAPGAWMRNFAAYPLLLAAPAVGLAGAALAGFGLRAGKERWALGGSSMSAAAIIATVGVSMFPIILPSTIDAHSSLTVWNASSSHLTLFVMLLATVVFLPIVLAYTAWVFHVLRGRTNTDAVLASHDYY